MLGSTSGHSSCTKHPTPEVLSDKVSPLRLGSSTAERDRVLRAEPAASPCGLLVPAGHPHHSKFQRGTPGKELSWSEFSMWSPTPLLMAPWCLQGQEHTSRIRWGREIDAESGASEGQQGSARAELGSLAWPMSSWSLCSCGWVMHVQHLPPQVTSADCNAYDCYNNCPQANCRCCEDTDTIKN